MSAAPDFATDHRRGFKWGVENELVPVDVCQALRAASGLAKGRSQVRETEPGPTCPRAGWGGYTAPPGPGRPSDGSVPAANRLEASQVFLGHTRAEAREIYPVQRGLFARWVQARRGAGPSVSKSPSGSNSCRNVRVRNRGSAPERPLESGFLANSNARRWAAACLSPRSFPE